MVQVVLIAIFHFITFVLAGELIETPVKNRYFITGRGCGVATKIRYLNYFPEHFDNHECSFIEAKVVGNHPYIPLKEIHCETIDIGGNNVKWVDGTDLGLGCLGFVNTKMFTSDAEVYCRSLSESLHLVEIFSQTQQNFLKLKANQIGYETSGSLTGGRDYWIGLKRMGPSTWKWIHSKKNSQFTAWLPNSNEPHESSSESPLAILKNYGFYGQGYHWADFSIHNEHYPICQLDNECLDNQYTTCNHPIKVGFHQCIDDWCFQMGTDQQYTKCESASSDGKICYGPKIRYGTAIGGIPAYDGTFSNTNNILQWCKQLFPKSTMGSATYNSDDAINPLYWCISIHYTNPHWCHYVNGVWKDTILSNSIHLPCNQQTQYYCSMDYVYCN